MSVETREMKEIEAAVEGILFASGEPVQSPGILSDNPFPGNGQSQKQGV